jgi:hypothetical protein
MTFHGHSMKTSLRVRARVFFGLGASDVFVLMIVETILQCLGGRRGLVFSATRLVGDLSRAALMYISDWVRYADISCYEYAIVDGKDSCWRLLANKLTFNPQWRSWSSINETFLLSDLRIMTGVLFMARMGAH